LIKTEPVLSGRLIKLTNSVIFFWWANELLDLSSDIMRLGLKMVLDLAYTLDLPKAFKTPKFFSRMDF
jgi:HD-like signal output (HDOD) protein